jgi:hypothetical protein
MKKTTTPRKHPAAVALSRLAVEKGSPSRGGRARWASVPAEERSRILRRAAMARWHPNASTKAEDVSARRRRVGHSDGAPRFPEIIKSRLTSI